MTRRIIVSDVTGSGTQAPQQAVLPENTTTFLRGDGAFAAPVPGYITGDGGTVTQATSKATGVTLNKPTGAITMHNAALAAAAEVSFTVTNSTIAATDAVIVNHASAGTGGAYTVTAHTIAAGSFRIMVGNMSAGSLSEAIVIRFTIIKGVSA